MSSGATPKAGGDDYTTKEEGVPFIRAVDLVNGRVRDDSFIYIKKEIHDGMLRRTKVKHGDVLFSIAGTVGRSAIFDHEFEANINQAVSILRFNESEVNKLYFTIYFNSAVGKQYVSKYARQGLQTNLNLEEVSNLKIPLVDPQLQGRIAETVKKSITAEDQSKQLLQATKQAVEMAIEMDETTALQWLEAQSIFTQSTPILPHVF